MHLIKYKSMLQSISGDYFSSQGLIWVLEKIQNLRNKNPTRSWKPYAYNLKIENF